MAKQIMFVQVAADARPHDEFVEWLRFVEEKTQYKPIARTKEIAQQPANTRGMLVEQENTTISRKMLLPATQDFFKLRGEKTTRVTRSATEHISSACLAVCSGSHTTGVACSLRGAVLHATLSDLSASFAGHGRNSLVGALCRSKSLSQQCARKQPRPLHASPAVAQIFDAEMHVSGNSRARAMKTAWRTRVGRGAVLVPNTETLCRFEHMQGRVVAVNCTPPATRSRSSSQ